MGNGDVRPGRVKAGRSNAPESGAIVFLRLAFSQVLVLGACWASTHVGWVRGYLYYLAATAFILFWGVISEG